MHAHGIRRFVLIVVALIVSADLAKAATYTWDADANPANGVTDGSGTWNLSGLNWFNAGADIAWPNSLGDVAAFGQGGGGAGGGGTITLGTNLSAGQISFTGGDTGSFTLTGTGSPTLLLGSGGILVNAGAGAETFDSGMAISLNFSQAWTNNSSNLLTINSGVSAVIASTLSIGGSGSTTINGVLANGANQLELTVNGGANSVVTLGAANTYTGVTNVAAGTLRVNNASGSATASGTVFVSGSLQGSTTTGRGFIAGPVSVSNGGRLLASSGATLTLGSTLTLAAGSSSTCTLSGTPNGATGSPLIATGSNGGTSMTVTATHAINVAASSTINVPGGMPYALYDLYSYFGTPPSISSAQTPFTGVFTAGTAPAGFNLGLFEGTSAAGTILNNQVDVAVGAKPFVYLKSADAAGSTSFNAAGNWSNAAAPSSANNYIVSLNSLRSPTGTTAATFAGNSLTLGAGGILGIKTTNNVITTVPTLVLNGGTISNSQGSDGNNGTDIIAGNIIVTSTSTLDNGSGGAAARILKFAAPMTGPGGLIVNPSVVANSAVIFNAAELYTGATTVDGGTLQIGSGGSLSPLTTVVLGLQANNATFTLGDGTSAVSTTIAGLTTSGSGTANAVVGGNASVSTLTINNSGPDIYSGLLGGATASQNNLALVMSGSGTFTLSGPNTFNGGTTVNGAGTLQLSGNGTLGNVNNALNIASGILDLNRTSQAVGKLTSTGSGGVILNNGSSPSTLTVGSGDATGGNFSGAIGDNNNAGAGTVSLTKIGAGTITLSGPSTYTGATTVNGGTLALASPGGLGNTAITVTAGAALSVRPGSGSISVGSTSNPAAGATISLSFGGGALNGGTLDMLDGAIGTLNIKQGSGVATGMTLGTSGPLNPPVVALEISDNGSLTAADQIFVTNGVTVGLGTGALISITPVGSNPLHTGTYPLITAGSFANADRFSLTTASIAVGTNQYNLALSNSGTVENLIVSLGGPAAAYWSGAQNTNWNALTPSPGTNWVDGPTGVDTFALPSGGTNVFFTANSATHLATTLGADFSINSLTFTGTGTSAANSVTISGNTLTINASASNGNTAGSGIVVQPGSGAHTIASGMLLGASQTWTNNSTKLLTVSGGIGDAGHSFGLTVAGAGPILLSGNNSYAGTTTVAAGATLALAGLNTTSGTIAVNGTLRVNSSGALGSSPLTLNSGAMIDNTSGGSVTVADASLNTWAGNWSFGGTKPLNLGTGPITAGNAAYTITLGGTASTITFGGGLTNSSADNQTMTVNGAGNTLTVGGYQLSNSVANAIDVIAGSGNFTIAGPVINGLLATSGGLTYSGSGTLSLTGANTYTGPTTLNSGAITLGSLAGGGSLPNTAVVNFNGTSTFNYQGSSAGSGQTLGSVNYNVGDGTFRSTYGGGGTTSVSIASPVVRSLGATTNYVVSGGTNGSTNLIALTGVAPNSFIDQGTFFGGGDYGWYDAGGFVRAIKYGVDPNSISHGAAASVAGAPTNLYLQTTGAISAEETNTFTSLNITGINFFTLADGAVLTVNGIMESGTPGGSIIGGGAGIQAASGAELVIRTDGTNHALQFNTPILDNGGTSLTKSGTGFLTLTAASTYSGTTTVAAGTLNVANNSGSATGSGPVVVNSGGTLKGTGQIAGSLTVNTGGTFDIRFNDGLFISGPVTINSGANFLAGSDEGGVFALGGVTLAGGSSINLSSLPSVPASFPIVITAGGGTSSLTVGAAGHTINVDPSSTIVVPAGMPYALYQVYGYTGPGPSVTSTTAPFTGRFIPGTVPSGLNMGILQGSDLNGVNNQIDIAVGNKPFVYLKAGDAANFSSFNSATNWSDGAAPSAANNYVVSLNSLRSPTGNTAATFAGNSLTLGAGTTASNGFLGLKTTNGVTTTVPLLILNGGTVSNSQGSDGVNGLDILAGNIILTAPSFLDSGASAARTLQVDAPISGPSSLLVGFNPTSTGVVILTAGESYAGSTTVNVGTLQLSGGGALPATTVVSLGNSSFATTTSATLALGDSSGPSNQTIAGLATSGSGGANRVVGNSAAISTLTIANSSLFTFNGTLGGPGANQNNLGLTVAGSSTLILTGINSYIGPTTVNSGILVATATGSLGTGPLVVNSSGPPSIVNLIGMQSIDTLSGTVSGGGTARISVGSALAVNQSADATFAGTVNLAGTNLTKLGGHTLEITGGLLLGGSSSISIMEGTLRLAPTSGLPSVGTGVIVSISGSSTLELAGSVSSLGTAVAGQRANIQNDSTAAAGLLVSGTHQQIGPIDGLGTTQVNGGADLTADHIVQAALVIGGDMSLQGLVTIAASDNNGNPLGTIAAATLALPSADVTMGAGLHGVSQSPSLAADLRFPLNNGMVHAGSAAVPEPSAIVLACLALVAIGILRLSTCG